MNCFILPHLVASQSGLLVSLSPCWNNFPSNTVVALLNALLVISLDVNLLLNARSVYNTNKSIKLKYILFAIFLDRKRSCKIFILK